MRQINETDLRQIGYLIEEISRLAAQADRLCAHFDTDTEDLAQYRDHNEMLRGVVQRAGWVADLATTRLGGEPFLGDASDWMLPPACQASDEP